MRDSNGIVVNCGSKIIFPLNVNTALRMARFAATKTNKKRVNDVVCVVTDLGGLNGFEIVGIRNATVRSMEKISSLGAL